MSGIGRRSSCRFCGRRRARRGDSGGQGAGAAGAAAAEPGGSGEPVSRFFGRGLGGVVGVAGGIASVSSGRGIGGFGSVRGSASVFGRFGVGAADSLGVARGVGRGQRGGAVADGPVAGRGVACGRGGVLRRAIAVGIAAGSSARASGSGIHVAGRTAARRAPGADGGFGGFVPASGAGAVALGRGGGAAAFEGGPVSFWAPRSGVPLPAYSVGEGANRLPGAIAGLYDELLLAVPRTRRNGGYTLRLPFSWFRDVSFEAGKFKAYRDMEVLRAAMEGVNRLRTTEKGGGAATASVSHVCKPDRRGTKRTAISASARRVLGS